MFFCHAVIECGATEPVHVVKPGDVLVEATVDRAESRSEAVIVEGTLKITRVFVGDPALVGKFARCISANQPQRWLPVVVPVLKEKEFLLCCVRNIDGQYQLEGMAISGVFLPVRDQKSDKYVRARELLTAIEDIEQKQSTNELQYSRLVQYASSPNPHVAVWAINLLKSDFAGDNPTLIPTLEKLFSDESSTISTVMAADHALMHFRKFIWQNSKLRNDRLAVVVESKQLSPDDADRLAFWLRGYLLNKEASPGGDAVEATHATIELLKRGIANDAMPLRGRVNMARMIIDHPQTGSEDQMVFDTGWDIVHSSLPLEVRQQGVTILRSRKMNDARLARLKELLQQTIEIPLRRGIINILEHPETRPVRPGEIQSPSAKEEWSAKRPLTVEEETKVRSQCEILIDTQLPVAQRLESVAAAIKTRHVRFLPALLKVVHDETDDQSLRRKCAVALSSVPDRQSVDAMIELLQDKDPDLANSVRGHLLKLTGIGVGVDHGWDGNPASIARKAMYQDWTNWWKKNRYTVELNWTDKSNARFFEQVPTAEDVAP